MATFRSELNFRSIQIRTSPILFPLYAIFKTMLKKNFLLITLILATFTFAQNNENKSQNTETINSSRRFISNIEFLDFFYKNQVNFEDIEELISSKLYEYIQKDKFIELLNTKNQYTGKYISRDTLNNELSEDNLKWVFYFKVKYSNIETIERMGLFREKRGDEFKIFDYQIKENK